MNRNRGPNRVGIPVLAFMSLMPFMPKIRSMQADPMVILMSEVGKFDNWGIYDHPVKRMNS